MEEPPVGSGGSQVTDAGLDYDRMSCRPDGLLVETLPQGRPDHQCGRDEPNQ